MYYFYDWLREGGHCCFQMSKSELIPSYCLVHEDNSTKKGSYDWTRYHPQQQRKVTQMLGHSNQDPFSKDFYPWTSWDANLHCKGVSIKTQQWHGRHLHGYTKFFAEEKWHHNISIMPVDFNRTPWKTMSFLSLDKMEFYAPSKLIKRNKVHPKLL